MLLSGSFKDDRQVVRLIVFNPTARGTVALLVFS